VSFHTPGQTSGTRGRGSKPFAFGRGGGAAGASHGTQAKPRSGGSAALEFFKGFLRNPREVGSIIPSSRFLTRRVLRCGELASARVIVELGPGTGVLTREIVAAMRPDAKLVAIELLPSFVEVLRRELPHPRLHVIAGNATDVESALRSVGETGADLVLSGIPFSTMEQGEGRATLQAAMRVLRPGGRFVAYQFRSAVRRMAEPVFGPCTTHSGFWNIPPMRIYVWRRDESAPQQRLAQRSH
jgi:phosphatidylethanolamine/phosphatidyl-N-methylethanolamine N-methyltransferase